MAEPPGDRISKINPDSQQSTWDSKWTNKQTNSQAQVKWSIPPDGPYFHPPQLSQEELDDDDFWEQPAPSTRAPSKMGGVFSRPKGQGRDSERSVRSIGTQSKFQSDSYSSSNIEETNDSGLDLNQEPTFIPDNTRNTKSRPMISYSALKSSYEKIKAEDGVILPPFKADRALIHHRAPTHPQNQKPFYWTRLEDTEETLKQLKKSRHGVYLLLKNHYRLDTIPNTSDLEKHMRCANCQKTKKNLKGNDTCRFHSENICKKDQNGKKSHSCCNNLEPCQVRSQHQWEEILPIFQDHYNSFITAPEASEASSARNPRRAIVIDCEMVGILHGLSELARLCAVDYLTGEVLIDTFVDPVVRVVDYRSRYSGITAAILSAAKQNGNCLPGWRAARDALVKFMNSKTVLVGAALQNDLRILRLVHTNVVDASLVSQQKVRSPWNRTLALRTMCKEMLDLDIQVSDHGHDPLEDCMGTREVVLWMTHLSGSTFDKWATFKRKDEDIKYLQNKTKQAEKREREEYERETAEDERFFRATGIDPYAAFLDEAYDGGPGNAVEDQKSDGTNPYRDDFVGIPYVPIKDEVEW